MNKNLKEQYTACCQAYADLLLKHFGQTWSNAYWSLNRVGTNLCFIDSDNYDDYCLAMSDIAYIIDADVPVQTVRAWYIYNNRSRSIGLFTIDIEAWHEGGERVSDDDLQLLEELSEDMRTAASTDGEASPAYTNAKYRFILAKGRVINSLHIFASGINEERK